jgi:hypothetical protein
MNARVRNRLRSSWWVSGALVVAALIALAVGFCVFDADHGGTTDHAVPLDLCLGMLVASVTVVLLARLPLTGWVAAYHLLAVPSPAVTTPAPPPKSRSIV